MDVKLSELNREELEVIKYLLDDYEYRADELEFILTHEYRESPIKSSKVFVYLRENFDLENTRILPIKNLNDFYIRLADEFIRANKIVPPLLGSIDVKKLGRSLSENYRYKIIDSIIYYEEL